MADEARQGTKFPWDYDVPNNAFWNSLDYRISRNFLQCYTEAEISNMTFDETLSLQDKLIYLRSLLDKTLAEKEAQSAPVALHDADYKSWTTLKLGCSTTDHFLENYDAEEVIVREMYENGPDGTKSMSALHQLSGLMELTGQYSEAEKMGKEVLPWLQGHAMLGEDSPQALGSLRLISKAIWKQERFTEAEKWIQRCRDTVDEMGKGKFGKYQDSERKQLEEDVLALQKWKEGPGGNVM